MAKDFGFWTNKSHNWRALAMAFATSFILQAACSAGILIGNFESGDSNDLDGWGIGTNLSVDTAGATVGSGSLRVENPGGEQYVATEFSLIGNANTAALVAALTGPSGAVSMDITAIHMDGIPAYWLQVELLVNAEGHWGSAGHTGGGSGVNVSYSAAEPITYVFELSPAAKAAIATGYANNSYANIGLRHNSAGNQLLSR